MYKYSPVKIALTNLSLNSHQSCLFFLIKINLLQVGGKASHDLKKLLLVLMMTLPGTPAVQYDEDMDQSPVTSYQKLRCFKVCR